jgi:hypothetical protein
MLKWKYTAHLLGPTGETGFGCPPVVGTVRSFTLDGAIVKAFRQAIRRLKPTVGEYIVVEKIEGNHVVSEPHRIDEMC